ncbi:MAG: S1C family serine protease [Candidatus Kapaibacterium sp.]
MLNGSFLIVTIIAFITILNGCDARTENPDTELLAKSGSEIYSASETQNQMRQMQTIDIAESRRNAITEAVENCSPAIVGINITEIKEVQYRDRFHDHPMFRFFFGDRGRTYSRKYKVEGLGSGFLISADGYILTNHHVAGNASEIIVTLTNGEKYEAEIIGSDMVSDVALLKIDGKGLPYLKLGDSDDTIIGEWVIALGNPFGLFDINAKPTITVGVVSNTNVHMLQEDRPYNRVYKDMLQTDAAISSGNSGGPLVNSLGEVIGMNTIIFSTAQSRSGAGSIGIGFSIPINRVKKIVDILTEKGEIDRNFYTGMEIRELDDELARYLGTDKTEGVVIFAIERGSPADRSGLEPGDIIQKIDDMKILRPDDYYIAVNDAVTGQELDLTILRNDNRLKIQLILKPRKGM